MALTQLNGIGQNGQPDDQFAPLVNPGAVGFHRSSVQFDQTGHESEAYTQTALRLSPQILCPIEHLEKLVQTFRGNADAVVLDTNHDIASLKVSI